MTDRNNRGRQQSFPNQGGSYHNSQGRSNHGHRGGGSARGHFQGGSGRGRGQNQSPQRVFKQNGQVHTVKKEISDLENKTFQQSLVATTQQLGLQGSTSMPKRPAYGSKGRPITLWANYFELLPSKTAPFNRYDVSMIMMGKSDEEPKGKKLGRCMELLLQELPQTVSVATDYRKTLITPQKLPYEQREFVINYSSETEQSVSRRVNPKYRARVKYTGTFTFGDLLDYLSSTGLNDNSPNNKEEIIQATNIIIASGMKSNAGIITKKNKYFPAKGKLVDAWGLDSGFLEAFQGFFMSVRAATGRVLLNVQVQYVVTWKSQPMIELIRKLRNAEKKSESEIHHMIKGIAIELRHFPGRIKRVAGFALQSDGRNSEKPPQIRCSYASATDVQFWRSQPEPGEWVTVADHFNSTYGPLYGPLTAAAVPLLNVGSKSHPLYVPSEYCLIKELQPFDRKLSSKDTTTMQMRAVRRPAANAQTIFSSGIDLLRENSKSMLDAFGVGLNPSMIVVNARVLDPAGLAYQQQTIRPEDGSWNMVRKKFSLAAKVPVWTYLWIRTEVITNVKGNEVKIWKGGDFVDQQQVDQVVEDSRKTWESHGCVVQKPAPSYVLDLANPNDPDRQVDDIFAKISARNVAALVVILPRKSAPIYNAVKRAGDIKHGIHTVNVIAEQDKFCRRFFIKADQQRPGIPNAQYHANVILKLNLKLGGRNQVLQDADRGFIREGKTMLVGLDVTHPAPGSSRSAPSISSITASIDSHLSQWPADVTIQSRSKEMIEGLKNMFKSRLALWHKHQKKYPEEIVVYRDGVGESMYELVRQQELPEIQEACKELYPATDTDAGKPYITIVICGKRHHTRFYPTDEREAHLRTGGSKSGTVVDRGITEARIWDFYLQAHHALQGTPRPAHYVVIHDEVFRRRAAMMPDNDGRTVGQRAADEAESLTHAMCYMFGRATKAVSLCPPAYYADIVCERARVWLSGTFDDRSVASSQVEVRQEDVRVQARLKDTMFYM